MIRCHSSATSFPVRSLPSSLMYASCTAAISVLRSWTDHIMASDDSPASGLRDLLDDPRYQAREADVESILSEHEAPATNTVTSIHPQPHRTQTTTQALPTQEAVLCTSSETTTCYLPVTYRPRTKSRTPTSHRPPLPCGEGCLEQTAGLTS